MSTGATLGPGPPRPFSMHGAGQYGSGGGPEPNGYGGNGQPAKKAPVYPHIDDLVNAQPKYDINVPLGRLLNDAEQYSKQADTHVDFRRPHIGLEDYMCAFTLVVNIIPRHKDYPSLADRPELQRQYRGLQKTISKQFQRFEDVKEIIKKNNAESGVQPTAGSSKMTTTAGPTSAPRQQQDVGEKPAQAAPSNGNGGLKRSKPVIQRKPTYLLGKAVQHQRSQSEQVNGSATPPNTGPGMETLEARFARLRAAESKKASDYQNGAIKMPDPADHIRKSNGQPKPAGPRALPNGSSAPPRPNKIALDIQIPDLPRAPDAIYSPDRSNLEARNVVPPRPTPRTSLSDLSRRPYQNGRQSLDGRSTPPSNVTKPVPAPVPRLLLDATLLQAEEVKALMGKHKILFIDIRVRNRFDEGHIMSHSIICIEPAAIRNNMSAEDLESALVLSPDNEMALFQNRRNFDFIVYYDQSSRSNLYADATSDVEEETLRDFSKAVYEFDANNNLRCPPKLIVGGLDAWVELLGQGALATSHTYSAITPKAPGIMARPSFRTPSSGLTYQSRLDLKEEKQWQDKLATPDPGFAGRYPDLQTFETQHDPPPKNPLSNSMTDQSRFVAAQAAELSQYEFKTVARPPPSLSRPSYKGVSEERAAHPSSHGDRQGYFPEVKTISNISPSGGSVGRVGLYNLGNTCYMNSILQALSNTTWLQQYFLSGDFERNGQPPAKGTEMTRPPQLMSRNISFLFRYLWNSEYSFVKPQTLKNYIYRICSAKKDIPSQELFGGPMQQDAMEFFSFMLDIIDDENNPNRDQPEPPPLTKEEERLFQREGYHASFLFHYRRYLAAHRSILSQKMAVFTMQISKCGSCGWQWPNHAPPKYYLTLNLPQKGSSVRLEDILSTHYNASGRQTEVTEGFACEKCTKVTGKKVTRRVTESITRLPDTLVFALVRNIWTERGDQAKNEIQVRFPTEELDMRPYFYGVPNEAKAPSTRYRCYAVVQHWGKAVNEGHYTAVVRDRARTKEPKWVKFDDQAVIEKTESETQKNSSYLLFYERI